MCSSRSALSAFFNQFITVILLVFTLFSIVILVFVYLLNQTICTLTACHCPNDKENGCKTKNPQLFVQPDSGCCGHADRHNHYHTKLGHKRKCPKCFFPIILTFSHVLDYTHFLFKSLGKVWEKENYLDAFFKAR